MDFNTLAFLAFFAAVAVVYQILPKIIRPYLLLLASYGFYCYQPENLALVALLIGATVITWACGLALEYVENIWARRGFLALSIASCMGILFYFKYANFFSELFGIAQSSEGGFTATALIAPLGLSYFTFQALGYAIDCYRKKYKAERNPLMVALFVSFYPCIFTGPIERADHLIPQFKNPKPFSYNTLSGGAFRMLWGYFKKMVLADNLALYVSAFYAGNITQNGATMAAAAVLFALQLYFDFSGCCDIAIGGARLLGIDLLENFESPFFSTSFSQLWRRWHKSLTTWFRDYVYFSLGGNRCAAWRWAINFLLVFALSGLWHGAHIGYFYWGLLCGALVLAERLAQKYIPALAAKKGKEAEFHSIGAYILHILLSCVRCVLVFAEFSVCFILFASALYQTEIAQPMLLLLGSWNTAAFNTLWLAFESAGYTGTFAYVLLFGSLAVLILEAFGDVAKNIRRLFFPVRWAIYYALCFGILYFGVFGQSAFIYQLY